MSTHTIPARLLTHPVTVALVGCGGSGSQMLTGLARLDRAMRALGHPGGLRVTVYDPDKVSEANVGRQLYAPSDIGLYKSVVLCHRVNLFFGLDWRAVPDRYPPKRMETSDYVDLLISCVDTAKARRDIHEELERHYRKAAYWLDMGNRQQDGQVVMGEPSDGEKTDNIRFTSSDAVRRGRGKEESKPYLRPRLPVVTELFPELMDPRVKEDDRPSCSLAEALGQQDLFINQAVSTWALNLLWRLFRDGKIEAHGYFINLATGRVNPIPVPDIQEARQAA